jgi:hypothetical protein
MAPGRNRPSSDDLDGAELDACMVGSAEDETAGVPHVLQNLLPSKRTEEHSRHLSWADMRRM